ncbi:MAG: hypothetical protein ACREK6_07725, partial [Candidatus Rokuibacteriota bacterium]
MSRTVYYDARARIATVAASALAPEFDVQALVAGGPPPVTPAVLLIDGATDDRPVPAQVHVIALVDPQAAGPWPDHWYAVLPRGAGRPILAHAIANAFADLDTAAEVRRLGHELTELNTIGIRLSAE